MAHEILDWIEAHHPRAHATLREPANEMVIEAERLPDALAGLYRRHDGQEEGRMSHAFFDQAFSWLSLAEGRAERERTTKVLDDVRSEYPETEEFAESWFPFAADGLGNLLVVDTKGDEVFMFLHDEGCNDADRLSTRGFLDDYLNRLSSGELVVDEKLGVVSRDRPAPASVERRPPPLPAGKKMLLTAGLIVWVALMIAWVVWLELG